MIDCFEDSRSSFESIEMLATMSSTEVPRIFIAPSISSKIGIGETAIGTPAATPILTAPEADSLVFWYGKTSNSHLARVATATSSSRKSVTNLTLPARPFSLISELILFSMFPLPSLVAQSSISSFHPGNLSNALTS